MLLAVVVAAVPAISPVSVDVVTKDGVHHVVAVADADADPAEVCAAVDDNAAHDVCAAVSADHDGLHARIDVLDDGSLRFFVKSARTFDTRPGSAAALTGGVALATAVTGVSAFTLSALAVAPVSPEAAGTQSSLGAVSVALWGVTAVGTVATGVLAFSTYTDATTPHE